MTTSDVIIREATRSDAPALNAALRALSHALGDDHRACDADIARAGFGPDPAFRAIVAEGDDGLTGAALYSPVYSTVRGAAGAFVSDLWVADNMRGRRLGPRLLAAVAAAAARDWGAGFLRLTVYDDNPRAHAFYTRLGFRAHGGETSFTLDGAALEALKGQS